MVGKSIKVRETTGTYYVDVFEVNDDCFRGYMGYDKSDKRTIIGLFPWSACLKIKFIGTHNRNEKE